jgi:ribonuclease BN (tRNA processing enzyme)
MTTELVLLGTPGAPMPVAGRGGICSVIVVNERIFMIDCGRGAPSAFAEAGLDFTRLEAVFITHLHVDHTLDFHSGARKSEANAEGFVGRRTGARCARYCLPSVLPRLRSRFLRHAIKACPTNGG